MNPVKVGNLCMDNKKDAKRQLERDSAQAFAFRDIAEPNILLHRLAKRIKVVKTSYEWRIWKDSYEGVSSIWRGSKG